MEGIVLRLEIKKAPVYTGAQLMLERSRHIDSL